MSNVTYIIPDDAELFRVAQQAAAQGAIIISNGERFALSRDVPPGWHAMPVGDKSGEIRRAA